MLKRTVRTSDNEPDQKKFENPSEGEHLMAVSDIFTSEDPIGQKLGLDENTVSVKLEVAIGNELGRTLLLRCSLDPNAKSFFATRMFLKAIGCAYKGEFEIDVDSWQGRQAYVNVVHNGQYANVADYNFEKCASLSQVNPGGVSDPKDVAWEE